MRITTSIQTSSLSEIRVDPLTPTEKQAMLAESFGEIAEINATNLNLFLLQLQSIVTNYLQEYESNWLRFEQSFNLKNKIETVSQTTGNLNSAYRKLKNQQGSKRAAIDFIRTLEKGNYILEHIRQLLTSQTITTNFTIKASDGEIYYVDKSMTNYQLVLSTFGASGNNFVSLAYDVKINDTIATLKSSIAQDIYKITGTDIYTRIMEVKDRYLADFKAKYPKKANSFNSTDAEIFNLLQQRLRQGDISSLSQALTVSTYRKMYKEMGGRGGYRTTSTQLGDIGLIQDKLVSQKVNQVNFARQTLIHNRFKELQRILQTQNMSEIKAGFLRMFTEKQSRVGDNISKAVNREAIKTIRELFK